MNFTIAKKLKRPAKNQPGISLRSLKGDTEEASLLIMSDAGFDDIKGEVGAYRTLTGRAVGYATRGKTLEIHAKRSEDADAISIIFDFSKAVKFNSEDVLDTIDFYNERIASKAEPVIIPKNIEISMDSVHLDVETNAGEEIYKDLEKMCERYILGIVKPICTE